MKIAISSTGPSLDAPVDPRFGRAAYLLLVDPDSLEVETRENPHVVATGGAGIQSAQLVANEGAQAVLTGNIGPNAFQTLQAAGIQVITGIHGTVQEAAQAYKTGQYQPTTNATVPADFGRSPKGGSGQGRRRGGMGHA